MIYILLVLGFIILLGGAELLVRGAVSLAKSFNISKLVIGMTVIAFGTSSPELIVSINASVSGVPSLALGNLVGSNIANLVLVMAATTIIFPIVNINKNQINQAWINIFLGIVLIFDEIQSFRVSKGGAQESFGITPDMTTLGKIIGGGLPVGAFGGKDEIMELFDPTSNNYDIAHAGTFNGNPMTMEAGIAVMSNLNQPDFDYMNSLGEKLRQRLRSVFDEINLPVQITGFGSLFGINFNQNKIIDYRTFIENNSQMTKILFSYLRNNEVLLQLKNAGALNVLMGENEIDSFVDTTREIATQIKECVNE